MLSEQLNPHYCRTYLIGKEGDGRAVLVDPSLKHLDGILSAFRRSLFSRAA